MKGVSNGLQLCVGYSNGWVRVEVSQLFLHQCFYVNLVQETVYSKSFQREHGGVFRQLVFEKLNTIALL